MKRFCGRLFRKFVRLVCATWLIVCYRLRITGRENIPRQGAMLIISNHQSFLDPVILGVAGWTRQQFFVLARDSLFRNFLFGGLIHALNARPVQRGAADIKAMRFAIDLLKGGDSLMIFPEGTRTETGATLPFKSGVLMLVKRSGATVVPAAVEGPFGIWPRDRSRPKLFGRVGVQFGEPIPAEQLLAMDSEEALVSLREKIEHMRQQIADNFRGR